MHPSKCFKLTCSPVVLIRSLIEKHKDNQSGIQATLWINLASFFIRMGEFGMARDIFEEALDIESLGGVNTVRDLSVVFNAYVKFESQLLDIE